MPPTVVIEIALADNTDVPTDLIAAAYRASASAHVVLVLPQAARALVDRALDPLVADWGLAACGVKYLVTPAPSTLIPILRRAAWAMVESHALRTLCDAHGVTRLDAGAAVLRLLSDAPVHASSPARMRQSTGGWRTEATA